VGSFPAASLAGVFGAASAAAFFNRFVVAGKVEIKEWFGNIAFGGRVLFRGR